MILNGLANSSYWPWLIVLTGSSRLSYPVSGLSFILAYLSSAYLTLTYLNLAYLTLLSLPYRRARAALGRHGRAARQAGPRARRYGKLSKVR